MRKIYNYLIATCLTLMSLSVMAQNPLKLELSSIDTLSVQNGLVDVDVRVSDFESLIAVQYAITWDSTVLEITDIPFISQDLSGLSAGSFALPEQTNMMVKGRLLHTWNALDALPKSLPDDHLLFTMRFKAIGDPCEFTEFNFETGQNAFAIEVYDEDFVNIGATINNLPVLITGNGCDGFISTLACNNLVQLSLSPFPGATTITADMILEGGPYDYNVMEVDPPFVDCDDIGSNVLVTVTHLPSGNSCWGELSVEDKTPPVVVVESDLVVTLSTSNSANPFTATVFVEDLDEGSFDNCSSYENMTFEPASVTFNCSQLGEQEVVVTVTDEYGNANSAVSTVIVELNEDIQMVCPSNVVVECETDIDDAFVIDALLGRATTNVGCVPVYEDTFGYDQNQDGDKDDEYMLNGETISEEYFSGCSFGTVLRVWSIPGSNSACQQIIGLNNVGSSFDGSVMVDWPYSFDNVVSVTDNDGASCNACDVDESSAEILYDNNGIAIGVNIEVECEQALCEEPSWVSSTCSLIGWASETVITELGDGQKSIEKTYYVVDACQYDTITGEGRWSWTVNALVDNGIPDGLTMALSDASGDKGDEVCVPVRVYDFANVESVQGSMNWDASVAQFTRLSNFGLPGLNNGSFGITNTSNGQLSFAWFDNTTVTPATLSDGSSLFDVCFNLVGDEGSSTVLELTDVPTILEVTSMGEVVDYNIINGSLIVGESNCDDDQTSPVPYCLNNITVVLDEGEAEIWAIDFNAGSFDNCTSSDDLRFTFSNTPPSNDPDFVDSSSSRLFTTDDLTDNGEFITLNVYVWDENDNKDFCTVGLNLKDDPMSTANVRFKFEELYGAEGSVVCAPLRVDNFTDVEAAQGTVAWNPDVLEYVNVQNANLPSFSEGANINANNVADGVLPFVWFDVTGVTPVSLPNNTSLFEVCFELVGEQGESSVLTLIDTPTLVQVSSNGQRPHTVSNGSINILDENCSFTIMDIVWPTMALNVFVDGVDSGNISDLMSPSALLAINGIDSSDVFPDVIIDPNCSNIIGVTYEDDYFELGDGQFRINRNWTLLDWVTGQAFTFMQVIENVVDGGLICDFLPNSAPVGDCDSGHTLDDDIEWPDDISIADHRISPDELVSVLGIPFEDSRAVLVSNSDLYNLSYVDFLGELSQTELVIEREWNLERKNIVGLNWTYIQEISVDLTDFGQLVTVNTEKFRPVPGVVLNSGAVTDQDGIAYTEDDVDPVRLDASRNGINIRDLIMHRSHVLGIESLAGLQLDAADINEDGNITTLDLVEMERIILSYDSPYSESWKFVDQTEETSAGYAPKAHYLAYKPGDLDDSADLGAGGEVLESQNLFIQDILLNAGESYQIPMYINGNIEALATELHLVFDENKVEVVNVSSEQSFDEVSYNIINGNRLSMVTKNEMLDARLIDSLNSFITLEITALEDGTLKNVFGLSTANDSYILDSGMDLIVIEDFFENEITTSTEDIVKENLFKLYPNPAVDMIQLETDQWHLADDFEFALFAQDGRMVLKVFNENRIDLSMIETGVYSYRITTAEGLQIGKLMKIK